MFRIPFGYMPGHWGLKGRTKEIAKAEYELSGLPLELRLLEIQKADYDEKEYIKKKLDIELKYGIISDTQYHRKLVTLIEDEKQRNLAELELDFREGKIEALEYNKKSATLNGEPWVNVVNMNFGGKSALEGSFELDWNEAFVNKLREAGYAGVTDDAIVNQWFIEICRNVALEEFDGKGDFTADSAANLETIKRWNSEQLPHGRTGYS